VDGKPYAPYGPLIAILSIPHHLAARVVALVADIPRDSVAWTFVVSGLTMLTTSTGAALAVAGFHRAAMALGAASPVALILSLMLGGASVLWPYGTSFYSEGWQAATFVWAAAFLIEERVVAAAFLLTLAGLIKFTSIVFMPGFLVAVLAARTVSLPNRLRSAAALACGVACALVAHFAWNIYRFGDLFEFGYDWAETVPTMPARAFLASELPRGLAVLLLSPGKSILLWAPLVVLSFTRLRTCPRPVLAGVATSAFCGLVFYGAYLFPEGGYAHGPRHLVPIVPLLLLPAATPGQPWRREILIACSAVGLAFAVLAVSVSFLQDQAMGADFQRLAYYERIDPKPGRAWNRYRLEYVPFARTLGSGNWPANRRVGTGADFFFLHLLRARAAQREAQTIPIWLPWMLFFAWTALLAAAAVKLRQLARLKSSPTEGRSSPTEGRSSPTEGRSSPTEDQFSAVRSVRL
jgi:hypothetical protein